MGKFNNQRDMDEFVVKSVSMEPSPMIEELFPMIGCENDHAVFVMTEVFEFLYQWSDEDLIGVFDLSIIESDDILPLCLRESVEGFFMCVSFTEQEGFDISLFPRHVFCEKSGIKWRRTSVWRMRLVGV